MVAFSVEDFAGYEAETDEVGDGAEDRLEVVAAKVAHETAADDDAEEGGERRGPDHDPGIDEVAVSAVSITIEVWGESLQITTRLQHVDDDDGRNHSGAFTYSIVGPFRGWNHPRCSCRWPKGNPLATYLYNNPLAISATCPTTRMGGMSTATRRISTP